MNSDIIARITLEYMTVAAAGWLIATAAGG